MKKAVYPPLFLATVDQFLANYRQTMCVQCLFVIFLLVFRDDLSSQKDRGAVLLILSLVTHILKDGADASKVQIFDLGVWAVCLLLSHRLLGTSSNFDQLCGRTCSRISEQAEVGYFFFMFVAYFSRLGLLRLGVRCRT